MHIYHNGMVFTQAAGVLIFDKDGNLAVQHRDGKHEGFLPGGAKEATENPYETCLREVREETGLRLSGLKLLLVDHRTNRKRTTETLHFLFYGGTLTADQISSINVDGKEVDRMDFIRPDVAITLFDKPTRHRVELGLALLQTKQYSTICENGQILE